MNISASEIYTRLASLTAHAPESTPSFVDEISTLSPEKREAWAQFLSSIATTESIEHTIIAPIAKSYEDQEEVSVYLKSHAQDEQRHYVMIRDYVSSSFHYVKSRRTGSDVMVYDTLLPQIARVGTIKPLYFLAMLHFYEAFSVHFYKSLKRVAEADKLPGLVALIQAIEKDELRHLAGLEGLVLLHHAKKGQPGVLDLLAMRVLLGLLLIDIKTAPWAFFNRKVRRNVTCIGLIPETMDHDALQAAKHSLRFVQNPTRRAP